MHKKNNTASIKIITVLVLSIVFVSVCLANMTYAKYSQTEENEFTIESSSFYLISDTLSAAGGDTAFTGSFDIELYNFSDLTHYASYDIAYSVSVSNIQRSASGTVTLSDDQSGTLTGDTTTTATITVTPDADILAFDITITTTSGYGKTLTMHFGKEYAVTLDNQGGTGGTAGVNAIYGSNMPTATAPTLTGYIFSGYYTATSGAGTQYYTPQMASATTWDIASATTLYAYWIAE